MEFDLDKIQHVHCIGIGGIGISAVAKLMLARGKKVSGSDMSLSPITELLEKSGIDVKIGHKVENINSDVDLVIHTITIPPDNPELREAEKRNTARLTYPQMLSVVSKNMTTVAVSGTHGKTTTTAMLAKIFKDAGLDPTVVVGSLLKDFDGNLIVGKSDYFLVEACEYRRSFLNLHPNVLVITNIDADHLDYYKDITDIQSAFREIAVRVPKNGMLVCDKSNEKLQPVLENLDCKIMDYMDFFDDKINLKFPGKHNRLDAAACLAVCKFFDIQRKLAVKSLENFNGTWRRFEFKGENSRGAILYDDYAHHPSEIKATLAGLKEKFPNKKQVVFFQPHLYSRTKDHLEDFAQSFSDTDEIYILPIYAAREIFDPSVSGEMIVEKLKKSGRKSEYVKTFAEAATIVENLNKTCTVMTMGAGDVYKILDLVKKKEPVL
jgi:UDP-N-acetylmuramate--alanine ligase